MYVQPHHQRCVAGTSFDVSWQQIGSDGEAANPGTVTVTVTRADGTEIATAQATSGTLTAARTFTLTPALTATLDRLTATWTASGVTLATTVVDVCAAPWFSNAELRAEHKSLSNTSTYTPTLITVARLQVEGFIESITHRRFTPGYDYHVVRGTDRCELIVPNVNLRTIRTAALVDHAGTETTIDVATVTVDADSGIISRSSAWSSPWVRLGYEYGFATPPGDVKAAAMRLTREVLERSKVVAPDQAITWNSTDFGWSAVMVTPGVRGAHTSLPTVNEVLDRWMFNEIGIG